MWPTAASSTTVFLPKQTNTTNTPPTTERTVQGCLCAPEWKMDGAGKEAYRNRCAHPDGDTERKCRVDLATCPPGASVSAFDACSPLADNWGAPAVVRVRTYNNCTCLDGGWWYQYPPTAAAGAVNKTIYGCANPDGDPLGSWCAIDPESCGQFAGYLGSEPASTFAFDYCTSKRPPALNRKQSGCRTGAIGEWGQCGGKSGCTEFGCADAKWQGACCRAGLECRRQDAYYWQCVKPGTQMNTQAGEHLAAAPGDGPQQQPAEPHPEAGPSPAHPAAIHADRLPTEAAPERAPFSAESSERAADAGPPADPTEQRPVALIGVDPTSLNQTSLNLPALAGGGLPSLKRKEPGQTIYVNLRVNYPYEVLVADVGAVARFKNDMTSWLKANAGPAHYVYNAGVDGIYNGSVIAHAYVQYTDDAPEPLVEAAPKRLQEGAVRLYKDSGELGIGAVAF